MIRGQLARTLGVATIAALAGCDGSAELLLDLRTDLAPGREFAWVRTEVAPDAPMPSVPWTARTVETPASEDEDWFVGQRIAELDALEPGPRYIRVELRDEHGSMVTDRVVRLTLESGRRAETIVISNRCRDVVCPGPGDEDTDLACWAGRCVDPSCAGGDPATCGEPECMADADCGAPSSCADGRCVDGVCLGEPHEDRCTADEHCDVALGCVPESCGDGSRAPTEACDDGDTRGGDGCSASCEVEPGWSCWGSPSLCVGPPPTGICSMTSGTVTFMTPGPVEIVAPEGCGRGVFRMWGAGGAGGQSTCAVVDGEGGSATTLERATGELLAAAGGGGGGSYMHSGGTGAYVEASVIVSPGETLTLVVGTGGRVNIAAGGTPGIGPFAGPIDGGGRGFGAFVVAGNPTSSHPTLYAQPPYPGTTSPTAPGPYAYGGRSDLNCSDGPVPGGRGHAELRWGP